MDENQQPTILIECKHCDNDLATCDGRLMRYFHVTKARFGVLTNGIVYKFFTDLESPNIMDEKRYKLFIE